MSELAPETAPAPSSAPAAAWKTRSLGGAKQLAITWRAAPDTDLTVEWRLFVNNETQPAQIASGALNRNHTLDTVNLTQVFNDPNITHGEVGLRFEADIFLWCDIPLGRASWYSSTLDTWPGDPPEPRPPLPTPPDPFDPPVDDLGHRRLDWGASIEPGVERASILDFLWLETDSPPDAGGRFVAFDDGGAQSSSLDFVQTLAKSKAGAASPAAALTAMQGDAQAYLTATLPLTEAELNLADQVRRFMDDAAIAPGQMSLDNLLVLAQTDLGMTPEQFVQAQVTPPGGLFALIWQLLYAVVLATPVATPGDQAVSGPAVQALARTARGCSLIIALAQMNEALADPQVRRRLAQALLVLPPEIRPPPPAGAAAAACLGPGVQKSVDQTLQGYRLGEIADVLNVLPGERLTLVDRERMRQRESERLQGRDDHGEDHHQSWNGQTDLAQDIRDALSQTEVIRDYTSLTVDNEGWPELAISGSWWGEDGRQARRVGSAAKYLQALSRGVASRLATRVTRDRTVTLVREQEATQTRQVDNRGSTRPLVGAYHWLEKIYELRVRSVDRRLVLEFALDAPAGALIATVQAQPHLAPPLPPTTWSISLDPTDYASLTAANYGAAAAAYGLELAPPPPATAVARAVVSSQAPSADLVIPPGFQTSSVVVAYVIADAGQAFTAVVGSQAVAFTAPPAPPSPPAPSAPTSAPPVPSPQTYLPTPAKPASAVATATFTSPLTGAVPFVCRYDAGPFNAVAEANCTAINATAELTAWQVTGHQAILAAYDTARAAHARAVRDAILRASPEGVGRTINRAMTMDAMAALAGAVPTTAPTPPTVLAPGQATFFSDALDWQEATYAFFPWGADPVRRPSPVRWAGQAASERNAPAWLDTFLEAGSARMLVTVRRGYEVAVLFFLAFGYLPAELAAVFAGAAEAAWLSALAQPLPAEPDQGWTLQVPTDHMVLANPSQQPPYAP